jgi:hypothetical protein
MKVPARSSERAGFTQRRHDMYQTLQFLCRVAAVFTLLCAAACSAQAVSSNPSFAARIGVYDSRAVAIAYAGSPAFRKSLADLRAAQKAAREAGDRDTVERLDKTGRALQDKLHRQGFGTEPVDDLLAGFADALVQVKAEADVSELLSRWNADGLSRYPGAARIDVTRALVERITSDERQRKAAMEIVSKKPEK